MWTQLYGVNLSRSLFKLKSILVKAIQKICHLPRKSTQEIFETVISSDWEVDHGSDRNCWTDHDWLAAACVERETTLLTDRAVQFATAKTCVFSDSVLCLGGISTELVEAWESRITRFLETRYLKDLDRIDGEPMDFEWRVFPGITTLGILDEIQKMMTKSKCEPKQFKGNVQWHW